jgi:MFS family permease
MLRMLLVNQNYARLWAGQAVSLVGDYIFTTTLVLWISTVLLAGRSYAPAVVAALLLFTAVATLGVGPVAGVFVDRWDRRATMLRADLIRAGLVGALTAVAFLPAGTLSVPLTLAAIFATVLLASTAAQFFNPSRMALIGDVVAEPSDRARAFGIGQATQSLAAVLGPPLAAPLLFTIGLRWALLANALSFLVSFAAVRSVRVPAEIGESAAATAEHGGFWPELHDGLRVIGRSRVLQAVMVTALVATLGTGALNALGVFFVTETLHTDAKFYGTLDMGEGIGAIAGALVAGAVAARLGSERVVWLGLLLTGVGIIVWARLSNLVAAVVVVGLIGVPVAAINTAIGPLTLGATPREYIGRVFAIFNPAQQLAAILSIAAAGWLASTVLLGFHATIGPVHLGRIDTVFTGSAVLILAGAAYAAVALRRPDSPA